MSQRNAVIIHDELIIDKIYLIRGQKVMMDRDLAEMYGVETRMLNQAIKRNEKCFPGDFMFQLTNQELSDWKSQNVISNKEKMGIRKLPNVFTEQGVAMLSSVLNSETAIEVNIQIIRLFTKVRQMLTDFIPPKLFRDQSQIKAFRNLFRGVKNVEFFLYRLTQLYA